MFGFGVWVLVCVGLLGLLCVGWVLCLLRGVFDLGLGLWWVGCWILSCFCFELFDFVVVFLWVCFWDFGLLWVVFGLGLGWDGWVVGLCVVFVF